MAQYAPLNAPQALDGRLGRWSAAWRGACLVAGVLFGGVAQGETTWSYSGDNGPLRWAELSPDYSACAGSNQSPVDLNRFVEADLTPIRFSYAASGIDIFNNGHTVQMTSASGSEITVDGRVHRLLQLHFHAPSEHSIDGVSFPMELHFVHAADGGELAVVAVMFTVGDANGALAEAWRNVPDTVGERHVFGSPLAPADLLPADRDHYRFNGSLTTPPCTEGVLWLVMKQPVSASPAQIAAFAEMLSEPNNRSLQPLNARVVLR